MDTPFVDTLFVDTPLWSRSIYFINIFVHVFALYVRVGVPGMFLTFPRRNGQNRGPLVFSVTVFLKRTTKPDQFSVLFSRKILRFPCGASPSTPLAAPPGPNVAFCLGSRGDFQRATQQVVRNCNLKVMLPETRAHSSG